MNLLFDANHFQQRSFFSTNFSDKIKLTSEKDCNSYAKKLAIDFSYQIKLWQYTNISNIYWINDKKSWRKTETQNKEYALKYKENRSLSGDVNWDNYTIITENFKSILANNNIHTLSSEGSEADDWIAFIVNEKNKNNEKSIIISDDGDLKQLVSDNTAFYSVIKKVLITNNNLFNNKIAAQPIDIDYHILHKIIAGDAGDNIEKLKKGVGDKTIEKLSLNLKFKIEKLNDNTFINSLTKHFLSISNSNINEFDYYKAKILRNIKLIVLNEDFIPNDIWNKMELMYNMIGMQKLNIDFIKDYKNFISINGN